MTKSDEDLIIHESKSVVAQVNMMTPSTEPTATLSHLYRTDGSATFSQGGFTVIGAVNGPIEVQRRDELPEEASVDVVVRPAAGVGGTRERHLESVVQSTLRQIILVHSFPRTLIQVTLQITSTPEGETTSSRPTQAYSNLAIIPALMQTSVLALLSAAIPLAKTMSSVLLVVERNGLLQQVGTNSMGGEIKQATSVHVLAFTSHGDLLLVESEGEFTMDQWDQVYEKARHLCCGFKGTADVNTILDDGEDLTNGEMTRFLRSTLQEKVMSDLEWKR